MDRMIGDDAELREKTNEAVWRDNRPGSVEALPWSTPPCASSEWRDALLFASFEVLGSGEAIGPGWESSPLFHFPARHDQQLCGKTKPERVSFLEPRNT